MFPEVGGGAKAVLVIREQVNRHWLMPSQRQAITQPAVSSPQVQSLHRRTTAALQARQDAVFYRSKGARTYHPLKFIAAGEVMMRKRKVIFRARASATFRRPHNLIFPHEAQKVGFTI